MSKNVIPRAFSALAVLGWKPTKVDNGAFEITVKDEADANEQILDSRSAIVYFANENSPGLRWVRIDATDGAHQIVDYFCGIGDQFMATMAALTKPTNTSYEPRTQ